MESEKWILIGLAAVLGWLWWTGYWETEGFGNYGTTPWAAPWDWRAKSYYRWYRRRPYVYFRPWWWWY